MTIPSLRQALCWPILYLLAVALMLTMSGCGSGTLTHDSGSPVPNTHSTAPWSQQLAMLGELPAVPNAGRAVSAATPYNLLNSAPVASNAGVTWNPGSLILAPEAANANGIAWAVFGLSGFKTGIYPQTIAGDKGGPLWVGLSHYGDGRWDWRRVTSNPQNPWNKPYGASTGFVSTGGASYVAIVKVSSEDALARTLTALTLTASDALFVAPTASIAVASPRPTAEYAVTFDFSASMPGDGNITTVTFTPDNGDAPISLTPGDLALPQTHTYATPGSKTATLDLVDDNGGTDSAQVTFTVADTFKELLVIYNSDIPESADLANYYMSPDTGRGIDPDYSLGLALGPYAPSVPRDITPGVVDFEEDILAPIRAYLTGNPTVAADAKYLLLMKGVPHQIQGVEDFSGTLTNTTCSAVDSELCLINSYGQWPIGGYVWNADVYENFVEGDAGSFMWARNPSFAHGQFKTTDISGGSYDLDYLVGRIDSYDYASAKQLIDRSLAADTSGSGWVIFDSTQARKPLDTMVDPVWPYSMDGDALCGLELLTAAGMNVFADVTDSTMDASDTALLPPAFTNSLIGYCGWGVNHGGEGYPNGADYIWQNLGWTFLPGACFMSYESFNATSFSGTPASPSNRRGQGQISDFLYSGGTCAIGNVYEPYTIGVGDERWVFDRYLNHGDRWIEAAYKGLRLLSWQEVVVGDPLCRVRP